MKVGLGLCKEVMRLQIVTASKKGGWNFAHLSVSLNVYVSLSVCTLDRR